MQLYMRALEWAVSYRKESVTEYEDALRNAYTDAICEQILSGKYVTSKKNAPKREWEKTDVPLRLTDVHLFAAFLIADNNDLKFKPTLDVLFNASRGKSRHEKNKLKMISSQLKQHSKNW